MPLFQSLRKYLNISKVSDCLEFTIDSNNLIRIDKFIAENCSDITRSYAQKLINGGTAVLVNGKSVKSNYVLCGGDVVSVCPPPPENLDVKAEDIPLDIVFEDESLMVINKPQGMVVHPAPGNYNGTLVNAIMYHTGGRLSGINGVARPGIVHRLDKDTSGLIVVAKTNEAHLSLAKQIQDKVCRRQYKCIVHGNIKEDIGVIDAPIGRNPNNRKKMCVTENNSRNAVTEFEVLERFGDYTFVKCKLRTGRTHQIRVHMLYVGHPILGDDFYSANKNPFKVHRQVLHAYKMGFYHPVTNEYMEFQRDIPDNFARILEILRAKNNSLQ